MKAPKRRGSRPQVRTRPVVTKLCEALDNPRARIAQIVFEYRFDPRRGAAAPPRPSGRSSGRSSASTEEVNASTRVNKFSILQTTDGRTQIAGKQGFDASNFDLASLVREQAYDQPVGGPRRRLLGDGKLVFSA